MKKMIRFFRESYMELKRVVWPARDTVIASTKVVLVSVFLFAVVLGIVDFVLLRGLDFIF